MTRTLSVIHEGPQFAIRSYWDAAAGGEYSWLCSCTEAGSESDWQTCDLAMSDHAMAHGGAIDWSRP